MGLVLVTCGDIGNYWLRKLSRKAGLTGPKKNFDVLKLMVNVYYLIFFKIFINTSLSHIFLVLWDKQKSWTNKGKSKCSASKLGVGAQKYFTVTAVIKRVPGSNPILA